MTKSLFVAAGVGGLLLGMGVAVPSAQATIIGVNFYTTKGAANNPANVQLSPTDVVGAPGGASAGWYNGVDLGSADYIYSLIPSMTLTNSDGTPTLATLKINPNGSGLNGVERLSGSSVWRNDASDVGLVAEQRLYNAWIGTGGGRTTELSLQNIPYGTYDLYVYVSQSAYQSGSVQLFNNGVVSGAQSPIYFGAGLPWYPGDALPTTYAQVTSTDSLLPTATGNAGAYVLFSGLTDPAQSIDFIGNGGIAGIEIVAVPEPALLSLLGMGAAGLLARRRRQG